MKNDKFKLIEKKKRTCSTSTNIIEHVFSKLKKNLIFQFRLFKRRSVKGRSRYRMANLEMSECVGLAIDFIVFSNINYFYVKNNDINLFLGCFICQIKFELQE